MSQIRSFDDALDFYPASKLSLRTRIGGVLGKVGTYWDALVEGHAAARNYHLLRDRGMSHEQAASKVFAIHFH